MNDRQIDVDGLLCSLQVENDRLKARVAELEQGAKELWLRIGRMVEQGCEYRDVTNMACVELHKLFTAKTE